MLALTLLTLMLPLGEAQDINEDDLLNTPKRETIRDFDGNDDDLAFEATSRASYPRPAAFPLRPEGHTPLTPSFPALATHGMKGALIIELPVLVAHSAPDLTTPITLKAEILVDGKRQRTMTQRLDPATWVSKGPVWAFFKTQVAMPRPEATILVGVQRIHEDGTTTKLFMSPVPRTW